MSTPTPPPIIPKAPAPSNPGAGPGGSFARQAALFSFLAPFVSIGVNIFGHQSLRGNRVGTIILSGACALLILAGFVLGLGALIGTRKHGKKGIFARAIAGICINGFIIIFMLVAIPGFIKAAQRAKEMQRMEHNGTTVLESEPPGAAALVLNFVVFENIQLVGVTLLLFGTDAVALAEERPVTISGGKRELVMLAYGKSRLKKTKSNKVAETDYLIEASHIKNLVGATRLTLVARNDSGPVKFNFRPKENQIRKFAQYCEMKAKELAGISDEGSGTNAFAARLVDARFPSVIVQKGKDRIAGRVVIQSVPPGQAVFTIGSVIVEGARLRDQTLGITLAIYGTNTLEAQGGQRALISFGLKKLHLSTERSSEDFEGQGPREVSYYDLGLEQVNHLATATNFTFEAEGMMGKRIMFAFRSTNEMRDFAYYCNVKSTELGIRVPGNALPEIRGDSPAESAKP